MKALIIKARFNEEPSPEWIHRFRNFDEDVWRALETEAEISLEEIDHSISSFKVRGLKAKRVNRVRQTLQKMIDSHGLTEQIEVVQNT